MHVRGRQPVRARRPEARFRPASDHEGLRGNSDPAPVDNARMKTDQGAARKGLPPGQLVTCIVCRIPIVPVYPRPRMRQWNIAMLR